MFRPSFCQGFSPKGFSVLLTCLSILGGGGFVAPMMLRLAWHCSGTYCKTAQNGGSDGATMRFKPECDHGRLIFDLILDSLDYVKNYYTEHTIFFIAVSM